MPPQLSEFTINEIIHLLNDDYIPAQSSSWSNLLGTSGSFCYNLTPTFYTLNI
ncbi:predicted protein [Histoplasma mississippiense (nom. inval.)]|uniref:predicted protein n=1 Tax=Ajellomyces capsulatus (strain NAm1 / WU24) TaxID=2059318 RepID=UPI000157B7AF|nr:predicted protein [Histoplasma mississippiense (nom. inval.)]EDN03903.1 predicted protein [Histoplasma mississippiense (nom. inval.)]